MSPSHVYPTLDELITAQYLETPPAQGYLVDLEGNKLAPHDGVWNFTIGQRAKLGNQVHAMYVAKKSIGTSGQDILVVPGR